MGRVVLGSAVRTCLSNGQWSAPPTCINTCSPPSIPFGSSSISDDINPGQSASFSCNSGYILVGSSTATCQADGSFSALPTCEPACSPPTPVLNATYTPIQPLYRVNSTVSFTCSAGTQLTGNAVITCQANITWTAPPRCLRICEPPSAIMFGSFAPQNSSYNVNATVTYSCVMG
uniref:Sushi domain-containing protein n=1 Tax=Ciona savignyi TaxID=51511 RepID=H2Y5T4_CIOSA